MVSINKIMIVAVLAIAIVALTGVANATPAVKVDTIRTNGHYIGTAVKSSGDGSTYAYDYMFKSDGTYTVMGTITNSDNTTGYDVAITATSSAGPASGVFHVGSAVDTYTPYGPAAQQRQYWYTTSTKASFSITLSANSNKDITSVTASANGNTIAVDMSNIDYVTVDDMSSHTINQGRMSDAVAIYSNGRMNFGNSTLYLFTQ